MSETGAKLPVELHGPTNVAYIEQPADSEQCFASIVSIATGAPIHESQAGLFNADLVDHNGGVGGLGPEASFPVGGDKVDIIAYQSNEEPATTVAWIDEQLEAGKVVALLHKKNGNPEDPRYHWIAITGSHEVEGKKGSFHVMDPLRDSELDPVPESEDDHDTLGMRYVSRQRVTEIIRQSIVHEQREAAEVGLDRRTFIHAHAISTSADSSAGPITLKVEPKYDQEPEPVKETYSATGQGAITPHEHDEA